MQGSNGNGKPVTHKEDPFLSMSEVGRRLGKHVNTVKRYILEGFMRAQRMPNGTIQVRESVVSAILATTDLGAVVVQQHDPLAETDEPKPIDQDKSKHERRWRNAARQNSTQTK